MSVSRQTSQDFASPALDRLSERERHRLRVLARYRLRLRVDTTIRPLRAFLNDKYAS